jgi:hypothetical protein
MNELRSIASKRGTSRYSKREGAMGLVRMRELSSFRYALSSIVVRELGSKVLSRFIRIGGENEPTGHLRHDPGDA